MNFTDDRDQWWHLEHAFAGAIESKLAEVLPKHPLIEKMLDEDIYTCALEYGRGLDQDDFVELVRAVDPELLELVVEVKDD